MPRKRDTLSPAQISSKKFSTLETTGLLRLAVGQPERGFSMIVYGHAGSGKSTFVMWLVKEFSKFGKCYFNSVEMGVGVALQNLLERHGISELQNNKLTIADRHSVEEMDKSLETGRASFVFIDSLDFLDLSAREFKQLKLKFPNKSFIVISHAEGNKPLSRAAKSIEYMADIKCEVIDGVAFVRSRFGETDPICVLLNKAELSTNRRVIKAKQEGHLLNSIYEREIDS